MNHDCIFWLNACLLSGSSLSCITEPRAFLRPYREEFSMQHADILALAGLRVDGRRPEELRRINFVVGTGGHQADGSCYCEHGLNKVQVLVHGPQEVSRRDQAEDRAIISCRILNTPFSGSERKKRKASDRRSVELENMIKQTFEPIIMLDLYPLSEILFIINIFESDGSIESTIVNACTMALMDAGIAMVDVIASCTVGDIRNQICIDLNMVIDYRLLDYSQVSRLNKMLVGLMFLLR